MIAFVVVITILGLLGGQGWKWARRFGIPVFTFIASRFRAVPVLLLALPLSMGYGVSSNLMSWLGNDTLVRLVYAFLISLFFTRKGLRHWFWSAALLIGAFQIHAGSMGHIGSLDILVEDIIRYGIIAILLLEHYIKE